MGNFGKKVVSASLAAITSISMLGGGSFVAVAGAATAADLQAQINALLAQLQSLQTTTTSCTVPAASLTVGSTGANVTALQNWLVANGYGSFTATGYFGALTQAAVAKFQAAAGVTPAVGYYGPITMAALQARCGTTTTTTTTTTTGGSTTLSGSAGSITVSALSDYSAEEVGEDDEDVEIMAFEVEADDDSDVQVTSIKLEFFNSDTNSSEDLNDYADSVSVWFNGEMVGEDDVEDFTGNASGSIDVWTKTVSLDDVVIEAGETEEFVVAINAVSNIDSADHDSDSWAVDTLNVRFKDGDGVTTTEDTDAEALEKEFDFGTFAASTDVELKITSGDDEINDAHIVNVDDSDDTDNVELLSFRIEAEGDSDITLNDLPVVITTAENSGTDFNDPDDVLVNVSLYADGTKIATESLVTTDSDDDSETVTFDDLGYTIDAGDEVEFVVKAKVQDTGTGLDDGDTLSVDITATERGNIDADDETGEELASGDKTGTATGDAHAVYDIGFELELVGTPDVSNNDGSATSGGVDQGQYEITYSVTAFDGDIYIDSDCTEDTDGTYLSAAGVSYNVTNSSSNSSVCVIETDADTASGSYRVRDGETEEFTLTVNVTASADAFVEVSIEAIAWVATTAGGGSNLYTFNLDDFEVGPEFLNIFP